MPSNELIELHRKAAAILREIREESRNLNDVINDLDTCEAMREAIARFTAIKNDLADLEDELFCFDDDHLPDTGEDR
jgi:hypothetical protein